MGASSDSTRDGGQELISKAWRVIDAMSGRIDLCNKRDDPIVYYANDLGAIKETLVFCAHRLAFLEMVTKGLTYMEMHDARAYAKFVKKKRKLEDLDLEELRVLLR